MLLDRTRIDRDESELFVKNVPDRVPSLKQTLIPSLMQTVFENKSECCTVILNRIDAAFIAYEKPQAIIDMFEVSLGQMLDDASYLYCFRPEVRAAFNLIVEWFKILCLDLYYEKASKKFLEQCYRSEENQLDEFNEQGERISRQINFFNRIIEENNKEYSRKPINLDYKDPEALKSLILKEKAFANLPKSELIKTLTNDRALLTESINKYNLDKQSKVKAFENKKIQESEERLAIINAKLKPATDPAEFKLNFNPKGPKHDIDVFYSTSFENSDKYGIIVKIYKSLLNDKPQNRFIEGKLAYASELQPHLNKFEKNLNDYHKNYCKWYHRPHESIDKVDKILTECYQTYLARSPILNEHTSQAEFLKKTRLQFKKENEEKFFQAACQYSKELLSGPLRIRNRVSKEAQENQEKEIRDFKSYFTADVNTLELKSIELVELKQKVVDQEWQDYFTYILNQKKIDLEKSFPNTEALSLEQIKSIRLEFEATQLNIDGIITRANLLRNFYITNMLETTYKNILLNDIFFEKLDVRESEIVRINKEKLNISTAIESKPLPPPQVLLPVNKKFPWKKALLVSIGVTAAVALSLTIWGLVAGITFAAAYMMLGGMYGMGGVAAGGISSGFFGYFIKTHLTPSCCIPESRTATLPLKYPTSSNHSIKIRLPHRASSKPDISLSSNFSSDEEKFAIWEKQVTVLAQPLNPRAHLNSSRRP